MSSQATAAHIQCLISKSIEDMRARSYDRAIFQLRQALRDVKLIGDIDAELTKESYSLMKLKCVPLRDSFDKNQALHADHNAFSLFDRAMNVTAVVDLDQLSTVILYNLGLLFHCKAMVEDRGQETMLHKALEFYGLAMAVIDGAYAEQQGETQQAKAKSCHMLRMALFNNEGHIYSLLLDKVSVFHCLRHLNWELITATNRCQEDDYEAGDLVHFRINVVLQENGGANHCSPAPAA